MGFSSGNGRGPMADINVTPLVDVMLVLLIIFMVTAPMMNQAGVQIDIPRSEAPPLEPDPEKDPLILSIDRDLTAYIGSRPSQWDALPAKLAAVAAANPDIDVFLQADGAVPYQQIASMLGIAKKAGLQRVGLVFEPGVVLPDDTEE